MTKAIWLGRALSKVRADETATAYSIMPHDKHHLQAVKRPNEVISIGFGGEWRGPEQRLPGQRFTEASRLALFARAIGRSATQEHEAHTVVIPFTRADLEHWHWPNSWELADMASWTAMLNQSVLRNSNRRGRQVSYAG